MGMHEISRTLGWVLGLAAMAVATACSDDGEAEGSADGSSGGTTAASTSAADSTGDPASTGTTDMPTTTDAGESSSGGEPAELVGSCPGTTLRPRPADTAARGPWAVGARAVQIEGLAAEVWYPAEDPGPRADPVVYDVRDSLPASEQDKISDEDNPWQTCDCYRDLPIDAANGPYPVILFVHGTAGFSTQSLPHMTHWASRGFVVIAANHPGLWLADLLGLACGLGNVPQDLQGDLDVLVAAVRGEVGGLEAFADRLDPERIATTGHSAGGGAVAPTGDAARVVIPMAAGGVEAGTVLESSLVLGAMSDSVVAFSSQQGGYDTTPPRKRLVGIANTGHLVFSEMCALRNAAGDDLVEIAQANDICGAALASGLFQCDESFVPDPEAWEIIHFASSAVLEETLHCEPEAAAELGLIKGRFPVVLEFLEEL
jgi:Platelet-activating factor acetylhydrolase, isoform II